MTIQDAERPCSVPDAPVVEPARASAVEPVPAAGPAAAEPVSAAAPAAAAEPAPAAAPVSAASLRSGAERGRRARRIIGPLQASAPIPLTPRQQSYLRARRWTDALLAGAGLLATAVLMAAVAAGVAVSMGRPVLFTQERMTRDGRIFRLRKFRSMRAIAPDGSDDDAARLVPFGRFLRASSLDELPSLWNVVRGDLSLVGPRPLTTDYYGRFSAEQFARHGVPAGLTGYAQVNGRNMLAWDDRLTLDQEYVERVGPLLDLRILWDTVATVLRRDGVTDQGGVTMSDFPGPQSTDRLELELQQPRESAHPTAQRWLCRDREGRRILQGTVRVADGIAELRALRLGPGFTDLDLEVLDPDLLAPDIFDADLLDEAILLLTSRLRAVHQAQWAILTAEAPLPEMLADALGRAGFVVPGGDAGFPTRQLPPVPQHGGGGGLIGYLGLVEDGFDVPQLAALDQQRRTR